MEQGMSDKNIVNLIEWLKANGFDDEKIVECINFVSGK